ncbi:MAG: T9SS type A sorting domain-containing protein, partial [Bacteroidota bacterium]
SVAVTNSEGETAKDTVAITIDEPYNFSFPDSVRGVDEVALFGPFGNISYLWSTGETTQNIVVTVSGDYTLTVFTPFGCETTDTITVVLQELDIFKGGDGDGFSFAEILNNESFFLGSEGDGFSEASLTNELSFYGASLGDGYSLASLVNDQSYYLGSSGDGYSSNSFIQLANFFEGGSGDGYASADLIGRILGLIQDRSNAQMFRIYPNPTENSITIEGLEYDSHQVISLDGKVTQSKAGKKEIDLSQLKAGQYVLQLIKGKELIHTQTIIKR